MKPSFLFWSLRIIEWVWILVVLVSLFVIYSTWNIDRERSYMFILSGVLGVFMFFLRRKQRKGLTQKTKSNHDLNG